MKADALLAFFPGYLGRLGCITTLCAAPTLAQNDLIVPVTQDRYVSGEATADDFVTFLADSDVVTAPDFGPFVETAAASINDSDAFAQGGSSQSSQILPTSIIATGSHFANSEVYAFPWLAESTGISEMTITFELTTKASFTLQGSVEAFDFGVTSVSLRDGTNTTPYGGEVAFGPSEMFTFDDSGTLDPGLYILRARTHGDTYTNGFGFDYASGSFDATLDFTPLSGNYCATAPNSAGPGALISFSGSQDISAGTFNLDVSGSVPNEFGLFYYGPDPIQTPFGDGNRCVGGTSYRLQPPVLADGSGNASRPVDFNVPPAGGASAGVILPDSTWNFQWWNRDPSGALGSGFNLSDGLWVTFCP